MMLQGVLTWYFASLSSVCIVIRSSYHAVKDLLLLSQLMSFGLDS